MNIQAQPNLLDRVVGYSVPQRAALRIRATLNKRDMAFVMTPERG